MKKGMLVLGVILLMSVGLVGCSPGGNSPSSASQNELKICGMYAQENSPENYIIFRDDWTYIGVRPRSGEAVTVYVGEWGLGDDTLVLVHFYSSGGYSSSGEEWKVAGNKLIDDYGNTWIKQ